MRSHPNLHDVREARERIPAEVLDTPLVRSSWLSEVAGVDVRLKLENLQPSGSFKVRGAFNRLLSLGDHAKQQGIVACSTGNHGRAVAAVAARLEIDAVVVLSELVESPRRDAIAAEGADLLVHGANYDEAAAYARELCQARGRTLIHPFDDRDVIAGQGTIGLELLEVVPDLQAVLVPLSGGGLLSGIAVAVKNLAPQARVLGVSMTHGAAMVESQRAGRPIEVPEKGSIADNLGGGIGLDNRHTFALVREHVDDLLQVDEGDVRDAMRCLAERDHVVVEGAGAVGPAALASGRWCADRGPVVLVVTGGNVPLERLAEV